MTETTPTAQEEAPVFTCFPSLPPELRQAVLYIAVLETPSIVAADFVQLKAKDLLKFVLVPIRSSSSLLRVNWEARTEALKVLIEHHEPKDGEPKLYLNKSIGTLWCINTHNFVKNMEALVPETIRGQVLNVRQLVTTYEIWPKLIALPWSRDFLSIMKKIRSLGVEEVLIVVKPSHRYAAPWLYSNIEFVKAPEIDPLSEPVHWKMIRESLDVSTVTVHNIEIAMNLSAEEMWSESRRQLRAYMASGAYKTDREEMRQYTVGKIGGIHEWKMPKFRFVESVNLDEEKFQNLKRPAKKMRVNF